ncbi:NAD(P)H-binding protein [Amycolatopsis cynarae]|uniref:NAD(P)H-binding protein n=1 Tax=Amycolatopsis cynarae TaxID=2995223 RepID=A0ABY7AXU6_9PSEU|nr:NAD-dependent epimerase/dehydratase family protein [Amycolatopsis sp. HUAS 11-8]WAL63838.1 NAD(P)H-binding protein [Amycolatopsis sp. HUAS 11-8]
MSNPVPTVVVTGANSRTGRDLVPRLTGSGVRVVALVRTPEDLAADEVIADWTRSPRAAEALAEASAVVHLSGVFAAPDWDGYQAGNVATTRRVAEAIGPAARLVYLSYVGADPAADNWYLKSKGQAEDLLRSVRDSVIFRIHPIVRGGDAPSPFETMFRQTGPDSPVRVIGAGTQRFRPVHATDVVTALVNAVRGVGEAGTYDLVGPSEFPVTDLIERINGRTVPVERIPVEATAGLPWPPATVADLLANPVSPSDPDSAGRIFALNLTRPEVTWPITGPSRS